MRQGSRQPVDEALDRDTQSQGKVFAGRSQPCQHAPGRVAAHAVKKNRLAVMLVDDTGHLQVGTGRLVYLNQMASRAELTKGVSKVHCLGKVEPESDHTWSGFRLTGE
jgi:hypothetical protein